MSFRPKRHHVLLAILAVVVAFAIGAILGLFAGYQYPYKTVAPPPVPPGQTTPSCSDKSPKQLGMGSCLPNKTGVVKTGSLTFENAASITATTQGPDLSNNDPVYSDASWAQIGAHNSFAIFKVNQGTYYQDITAAPMAAAARRHGLAVGGYDFADVCHSSPQSEADVFVKLLVVDHLLYGANTLAPTGDMEYPTGSLGCNARAWIAAWVYAVHGHPLNTAHRWPMIYTGAWWWDPHVGCWWPGYSISWISGYTSASTILRYLPCGLNHLDIWQFTDAGWNGAISSDLSVWRAGVPAFEQASNAVPVDPLRVFPKTRFRLTFGAVASEYNTMATWRARHCLNPVRRPVCKSTRYHLRLLRDREWFVAHHQLVHSRWVRVNGKPRWNFTALHPLGSRFQLISHALGQTR